MSLSKEKSIEVNYRRDSFSDRVCDDLCKDILKYLSPKDCLRLECVSKQFQRTTLQSKCSLELDVRRSVDVLNQLMRKFPNVNEIIFGKTHTFDQKTVTMDLIEVIIKNCNNLTHIHFTSIMLMESKVQKKFFERFGRQLISIGIYCQYLSIGFTSTPNIEELNVYKFDSQLSQIEFNRLKRFKVSNLSVEELHLFDVFIENNAKTLKHLDIECSLIPVYNNQILDEEKERAKKLLEIIAKSINLVHLSFGECIKQRLFDNSFANYWNRIAINCKSIKSLNFQMIYNQTLGINGEMLSILKSFKLLKRLDLDLYYENSDKTVVDFYPFKDFEGLEGLTHFSLRIRTDSSNIKRFNETLLTDIDINLPKLRYLSINYTFSASEWTAQVLTRLSGLERIAIQVNNPRIKSEIERQLKEKCKHFKSYSKPRFSINY